MKKHLALALVMIMALVLLPQQGFAAGAVTLDIGGTITNHESFDHALSAFEAHSGSSATITLDDDYTSNGFILADKNLIVKSDATRRTITMTDKTIQFSNGTLEFQNLNINMSNTVNNGVSIQVVQAGARDTNFVLSNVALTLDGGEKTERGIGHQGALGSDIYNYH